MKPMRGRKTLRDTLIANENALKFYAAMASKPMPEAMVPIPPAPKQRIKSAEPRKEPLEKEIQKQILIMLKKHPKIQWVARFNSGTFMDGDRFITSNSQRGMSDILGMLKGGRMFAIECKSRTGKIMPHQQEFLDLISAGGGIAFVARCVEDVLSKL